MAITINTKTYNADVPSSKDTLAYLGPAHTLSHKDILVLSRTYPKPTATFSGVGRSTVKASRDVTLTDALTPKAPMSAELNLNIPVGASSADVDSLLADVAAAAAQQWAKDLAKNLDIQA